jgi:hypothetical protein
LPAAGRRSEESLFDVEFAACPPIASLGSIAAETLSRAFSFLILDINMEMSANPIRWAGCLFALALSAIFCGQPTLKVFASQEQSRKDRRTIQIRKTSEGTGKQVRKAEAANLPTVLRRDPGDIASLDLLNGAGGAKDAPDPHADYRISARRSGRGSRKWSRSGSRSAEPSQTLTPWRDSYLL